MTTNFDGVEIFSGASGSSNDAKPRFSIIWLHGLGADGNDFAPVVPQLEKLGVTNCRYVFPHAPTQAVTINGGMQMRSWYDIKSLDFDEREQDSSGVNASARHVEALINREIDRGIESDRIILAGFSQGGAVVLHTALRLDKKIAGVIALSTYLPLAATVANEKSVVNQQTPIYMAHGEHDDVINIRYAKASRDALESHGYQVQWKSFPMAHSLSMEEITDLAKWIVSRTNDF